jgi:hypothetical protein
VPSAYEFLARIFGTKPIRIRLAPDAFVFSQGESRNRIRPIVWFEPAASSGPILAVGDQSPPPNAVAVDLAADGIAAIPVAQRERALEAVLRFGVKSLRNPATIAVQRPEVIFENDELLAAAFDHKQREALINAVGWAFGCRFE